MAFHVPEQFRVQDVARYRGLKGNNGAFMFDSPIPGRKLATIASDGSYWELAKQRGMVTGEPWEHVSVHALDGRKEYVPTWKEMSFVKDLFWDAEDTVIQFHPPKSSYVNNHQSTLHLWRPLNVVLPLPPTNLV